MNMDIKFPTHKLGIGRFKPQQRVMLDKSMLEDPQLLRRPQELLHMIYIYESLLIYYEKGGITLQLCLSLFCLYFY